MSANDFITGRSLALPTCQFCYWPNYHQPIMLKVRLAWLWWRRVWPVLPWLRVIWLVDLTCERHEREFCTRSFKITELEKGRWSWITNCGEAFHTDSWLAEANPGHSDRDSILPSLLPGPSTVVLLGPGKARMRSHVSSEKCPSHYVKYMHSSLHANIWWRHFLLSSVHFRPCNESMFLHLWLCIYTLIVFIHDF